MRVRPEADLYGDLWKLLVTPRSHDLDTYEWLCAAEQTLSDLRTLAAVAGVATRWDRALAMLRTNAVKTAE